MDFRTPPSNASLRKIVVRGDKLAVWDKPGVGLPFVLVHGNSSSKEAFRPLIETAALAHHRIIAFDLPGCGESSDAADPHETYTLPGLAGVIVELARQLDIPDYVVVGWSMGGHVAIEGLRLGLKPRGLVLTGTPPCGPSPKEIAETFLPADGAEAMSMANPPEELLRRYLTTVYRPSALSPALLRDGLRADGRLRQRLFEHIFATPDSPPQRSTVAAWPGPIAVIQGTEEPFFDPKALDGLRWGNLWRGKCQWIDGAGHAPFLDRSAGYAALLDAFARDANT